jgi:RNA polymerase sigma-70 factor, ECF subfamily
MGDGDEALKASNGLDKQAENLLVTRLRTGETGAVELLVNTYINRLFSLVMHEVGGDIPASQDIVQETFLSAIKSVTKFKGESRVYTWLVGIAHHKVADYYRALKREHQHTTRLSNSQMAGKSEIIDASPSPEILTENAEESLLVEKALKELPADYRQVLLYKYVDDLSVLEISQIMKKSAKSIEGLLSRARREFKIHLDAYEG